MEIDTLRKRSCVAGPEYPAEPSIAFDTDPPVVRVVVDEPAWVRFREDGQETLVRPPGATFRDFATDAPETGVSRLWARQAGEERAYVVALAEPRLPPKEVDRTDPLLFPQLAKTHHRGRLTSRGMRHRYVRQTLARG